MLAVAGAQATDTPSAAKPEPYWQRNGCERPAPRIAKRIRHRLRAPQRLSRARARKLRALTHCARTYHRAKALRRLYRKLIRWRRRNAWQLRFARLPSSWQGWAHSTAACESDHGRNPRTNSNGYRGIFQWVLSTWYSAGGTGDPAVAGFHHEAVIAVGLARREGTQHWPNCGR